MFKLHISNQRSGSTPIELIVNEGLHNLPSDVQEATGYQQLLMMGRHRLLLGPDEILRWHGHRKIGLKGAGLHVTSMDGIRRGARVGKTTRRIVPEKQRDFRFELRPDAQAAKPLDDYPILVGRDRRCDVVLDDPGVSAFNTAILASRDHVTVQDLSSLNGTRLNGNRIQSAQVLSGKLTIGDTLLSIGRVRQSVRPIELRSEAMRRIYRVVTRVAYSDVSVVILGESGTGKDVIAQRIHEESGRPGKFVAINAAAISDNLAASELFGHVRGSYTGAVEDHTGAFREAHCGTLFLDEIGDMPLSLQAEILRAVESKGIRPVGSLQTYEVDVRIIAATNKDLANMVRRGEFREDLYHRLTVVPIEIPPLRERPEDISVLIEHFLSNMDVPRRVSLKALEILSKHTWPGNVRELSNTLKRAAVISDKLVLEAADLTIRKPETAVTPIGDLIHDVVIETYLRLGSAVETAKVLGLRRPVVRHHIKLWQKNEEGEH